jgi:putative Mn2+ efflux pump MntP
VSTLLGLLAVSVTVGLSNFAGAIGIGLSGIDARTRLRVGIAFGVFEALMPLAGLVIGSSVTGLVGHYSSYFAAGLLILTGAYTIWQGRRVRPETATAAPSRGLRLLVTGLALSIDNLAVGFALGVYRVPVVLAAITMGVVSVAMSLIGLELGHRLGARVEAWSEELSGAVLILLGLALALGLVK